MILPQGTTIPVVPCYGVEGAGQRERFALAQVEGPEGGGGARVQLLKRLHVTVSGVLTPGAARLWFLTQSAVPHPGASRQRQARTLGDWPYRRRNCLGRVRCLRDPAETPESPERGGAGISVSAGVPERGDMNGFTPEEMSRGGDAAAAVAAVVAAAAAAAASAGNGAGAGAGAEVPGAGAVSAAGPPGAAGPGPGQLCCLREDGERCGRAAGNASFSKRIQKSISQKKVKIELDKSVSDGGTALPCPPPWSSRSGADRDC